MIAEPLMGAGGVILPPEGYFPSIQAVLDQYNIPLIADEVVTAFGRTGNAFGSETYEIKPTSMTIAKALSSDITRRECFRYGHGSWFYFICFRTKGVALSLIHI